MTNEQNATRLQRGRAPESAEMSSGNGGGTGQRLGFNGAALRRARRSCACRSMTRWRSSFNGAALRRARRSSGDWGLRFPGLVASTGPRSGERGDEFGVSRVYRPPSGWSHPRSGERGDEFGVSQAYVSMVWLQRGRAPESAEIWRARSLWFQGFQASTGPRSGERGDATTVVDVAAQKPSFNGAALRRARRWRCRRT